MMKIPAVFAWVLLGAGLWSHWTNDFAASVSSAPQAEVAAPVAQPDSPTYSPIANRGI